MLFCTEEGIANQYVKEYFATMRFIVSIGWSICPSGYCFGHLQDAVDDDTLNHIYDLADYVNKMAFCFAIWASAKNNTLVEGKVSICISLSSSTRLGNLRRECCTRSMLTCSQHDSEVIQCPC